MTTIHSDMPGEGLAGSLAEAHRSAALLAHENYAVPASTVEAMAAQARVAALLDDRIAGWKVALRPDGEAVAAPIHERFLHRSGAPWRVALHQGCGAEVEICIRLARDLPKRAEPYAREDILDAVAEMFVGLEWVESRFRDREAAPFPLQLADNMNHGGYVCGAPAAQWRGLDLPKLRCSAWIDGREVHNAVGGHGNGDPMAPLVGFANVQNDGFGGLKAGQIVTTGSLTPLLVMTGAGRLEGEVEGLGRISVDLERR